ncbi:ORF B53 [Sulfolobus virus Kamchatka 1]|uniref:ORF B53 n=1 Tax=Sulfolobus virus Kamchatka 1 TaxID=248496 RepID=Q6TDM3_9VIRU|nr:ORF B53 [Sulfolobus virus Kamchatka 1]AAQ94376.1 ORF B53 [Sulfolobus virus Kamchatka 1]
MDVVKVVKIIINNNPKLKEELLHKGFIEERNGEIVILKPEVFEMVKWKLVDKR